MDFQNITQEQMNAAVAKFTTNGRGIINNQYGTQAFRSDQAHTNESQWNELINSKLHSIGSLKNLLRHYGRRIALNTQDPILGDNDIVFIHVDERDEEVQFTAEDCYLFVRAALVRQTETAEYKAEKREYEAAKKFLEENKTLSQKRADMKSVVARFEKAQNV